VYAPRGAHFLPAADGNRPGLVVADTGNHRILIWPELPAADGQPATGVLGQVDLRTEGPQAGGTGPTAGLNLPTGLADDGELLFVADAWNHRILGYPLADLASARGPRPVWSLGQPDLEQVAPNAGGDPTGSSLYWPFGVLWHDGWLWVADTGNRRVLGWHGRPRTPDQSADLVLGQPDAFSRGENRDGEPGPDSFRWPHQMAAHDGVLWVADAGNHRTLGWPLPLTGDGPATHLLGQRDFHRTFELPHQPQGPERLRFCYAVTSVGDQLVIGDTANNRVLCWADPTHESAAVAVLGQVDFNRAGENRWRAVTSDSLCWPYGLAATRDETGDHLLAIADSGNNRVVIWRRPAAGR
jgi:hypothetical protein